MDTPSAGQRRFVTVVRTDVEGSTRLGEQHDPELIRTVLGRYYEAARSAFERHGGTIEQYQGDAVVALFGIPHLHEDDALRAVRAAMELRDRTDEIDRDLRDRLGLRLPIRTAVHSGEIVTGSTAPGQLTGDVMNVVAHLEKLAEPGQIILGDSTLRLVRGAVQVQELGPRKLKRRSAPVIAHRLVKVRPGASWRTSVAIPMVGREPELTVLAATYERAMTRYNCHLLTLVGEAGVGKSRLVEELLTTVDQQARVLRSSSQAYDSSTYDAIVQVVTEAAALDLVDREEATRRLAGLMTDVEDADRIVQRIGQLLGLHEGTAPPEDVHWALRRFLEVFARSQPLVVVLDDLHSADPALLDLVEAIAMSSRGARLLILCTARRELMARRARWAGGAMNAVSLHLAPLDGQEVRQLVIHLLGGVDIAEEVQQYVVDRSGGNPLFVQGLVAMLRENRHIRLRGRRWRAATDLAEVRAPPDIRALLGARLDHLGRTERAVIERAAVIGHQFTVRAIRELTPPAERGALAARFRTLAAKDLIVPDEDAHLDDEGYAFTHLLIQEVAYDGIAKETRADLHERYATWLERERGGGGVQVEETIGSHLDRAYRNLVDIGREGERTTRLARRAGTALALAGHRAAARRNTPDTTVRLLERAVELLADNDETRRTALIDYAYALSNARRFQEALEAYSQAVKEAAEADDLRRQTHGRLGAVAVKHFSGRETITLHEETIELALQVFERDDDKPGLATTWRLRAYAFWEAGLLTRAEMQARHAVRLAQQAGDEPLQARSNSTLCFILFWGPKHVDEAAEHVRGALDWARRRGVRSLEIDALRILARIAAMRGEFEKARELLRETETVNEYADTLGLVGGFVSAGLVELLADRPATAERVLRRGYRTLEHMGGRGQLLHVATLLARALAGQGRDREAVEMTRHCERLATPRQLDAQIKWRSIRATVLVRNGDHETAQRLAREAVELTGDWEQHDSTAEALADYADVMRQVGRAEQAYVPALRAFFLYRLKGNLVGAERMRRFVEAGAA